jgi:ABC-type transport system involved in multi-copper enzyme maturation permease subunit
MNRIWAIAANTFRETVRDRILYGLVVFALIVLPGSRLVISLSVGQEIRILKDFGYGAIALFGLLIAVISGTALLFKELDKRTIYVLVAKPVRRWELLVGKYFGLLATLLLAFLIMAATLAATLLLLGGKADGLFWLTIAGLYLQLTVVTAVAILFSTLASPALGAVFTFCVYIAGTAADQLRLFADRMPGQALRLAAKGVSYAIPNLQNFNFRTESVYGLPADPAKVWLMLLYAVLYAAFTLALASVILERKDLK